MDLKKTLNAENDVLLHGFPNINKTLKPSHPIQLVEQKHDFQQEQLRLDLLKKNQGLHAPLRLMIEKKLASEVGRLPCLKSSNLMLEVIDGKNYDYLDFNDFFKEQMESEKATSPHLLMEKRLGLL